MLSGLGYILLYVVPSFLLVLTFIVTIHELGHFLVARAFKVKIDTFSIGFGKTLFSRRDRQGVEWRVAALPLGGYVKFSGDLDASSVPDEAGLSELRQRVIAQHGPGAERDYFHFKPVWQRALITVAGPAANFALAIVLFTILFSFIGLQVYPPRVQGVEAGGPAAAAGFQTRDLITAINGRPVYDSEEVIRAVRLSGDTPMTFTVDRAGQALTLSATPVRKMKDDELAGRVRTAQIGLNLAPLRSEVEIRRVSPIEAAGMGVKRTGEVLSTTLTYLGRIFLGRESGDQLSGPLGIAKAAGGVTKQAAAVEGDFGVKAATVALNLLQLAAILSIGIGFLNLLPIPVLDGGHLTFYAYEAVARRPVAAKVQEAGYRVGLALLACFMLFATWNDIQKFNLFKFLGGLAS